VAEHRAVELCEVRELRREPLDVEPEDEDALPAARRRKLEQELVKRTPEERRLPGEPRTDDGTAEAVGNGLSGVEAVPLEECSRNLRHRVAVRLLRAPREEGLVRRSPDPQREVRALVAARRLREGDAVPGDRRERGLELGRRLLRREEVLEHLLQLHVLIVSGGD
jgi:hypothetical protein